MVDGANGNGQSIVGLVERAAAPDDDYFHAVGTTGLLSFGGFVLEEFLPELRWPQAARVYREMSDNDPVIGAFLNAADLSIRRAERIVKAADDSPRSTEAHDLCERALDDMGAGVETWADTMSSFLSMIPYGFAANEIILKRCEGPRAQQPSKYTDGKIGVDSLPIRAQETLLQWELDADVPYVKQQAIGYPVTDISYAKLLHFRTRAFKNNPLGYSLLRRAYPSWYRIRVFQWIESIGVERDLAGLPIVWMPEAILTGTDTRSTQIRNALVDAGKNVRNNEAAAIAMALEYNEALTTPAKKYDFTLLSAPGNRQFDIGAIITRYEQRILMSVLADFLMLGHEGVGSLGINVGIAKIDLFLASLETLGSQIASQMNRLFTLLTTLNGLPYEVAPTFEFGPLNKADVGDIAKNLLSLAQAGFAVGGDPKLTDFVLDSMDLPHEEATEAAPLPPMPPRNPLPPE